MLRKRRSILFREYQNLSLFLQRRNSKWEYRRYDDGKRQRFHRVLWFFFLTLIEWLFDTITLGPFLEASLPGNGVLVVPEQEALATKGWTQVYGNDHWAVVNSGTSWAGQDFNGWVFIDAATWKGANVTGGDQYRYWALGNSNTILVADMDEYADGTTGENGVFDATLVSPAISLGGISGSVVVSFNENYRHNGAQEVCLCNMTIPLIWRFRPPFRTRRTRVSLRPIQIR